MDSGIRKSKIRRYHPLLLCTDPAGVAVIPIYKELVPTYMGLPATYMIV